MKFLDRAKSAGIKVHCKNAITHAIFFVSIFGAYAYAFYMGKVWIEKEILNTRYNRFYSPGDILSCFNGIVFGMFALGMASPNIKAVVEGLQAGKMAFDVIDRVSPIPEDC